MPDDWAIWKDDWAAVTGQYGLVHGDMDVSAAEELLLFETENEADTKDIGDERQAFGPAAAEMGAVQPCKASTCNSIPDWTKDTDGK